MMEKTKSDKTRIDKYLWAIRIFKTRAQATDACSKGKVKMHGKVLKASKTVDIKDEYEIKGETRFWQIRVLGILHQRVQYSEAIQFYEDLTPPDEIPGKAAFSGAAFHTGKRLSKIGRPTKKKRRSLEDFWDNSAEA